MNNNILNIHEPKWQKVESTKTKINILKLQKSEGTKTKSTEIKVQYYKIVVIPVFSFELIVKLFSQGV